MRTRGAAWGGPARPHCAPNPARVPGPRAATYPAGRAPGAPAVLIAEGAGGAAPAGCQPRPRCSRQIPEPGAVRPNRDAEAGEGRGGGGEGGGAGPGLALVCPPA